MMQVTGHLMVCILWEAGLNGLHSFWPQNLFSTSGRISYSPLRSAHVLLLVRDAHLPLPQ